MPVVRSLSLAFLLAAGALTAQQEPTIRVDVQQVLVPVIVMDKKGHHVSGLRAADFRILEDGVPQEIASFTSDTAGSVNDLGALTRSAPEPSGARRTVVICLDTLHTSQAHAARMREALEALFEKEKTGDAQYVLVGIGRQMQVLQPATTNPLAILQKVRAPAFQGLMAGLDASALAAQMNNLRSRLEDLCRRCACSVGKSSQVSCEGQLEPLKQGIDADIARWTAPTNALLDQFKNVVAELAKVPTGRTLILISDGFDVDPARDFYLTAASYLPGRPQFRVDEAGATPPAFAEAMKVAADRNVAVYSIDLCGGSAPTLASVGSMDAGASSSNGGFQSVLGTRSAGPGVRQSTLQSAPEQHGNVLASEDSASMEQLARSTGGVYFHDPNNAAKGLRNALADGREYYVLAYVSKNSARDGKFRRITVETTNKTLTLRAKPGYWAEASAQ